MRSLPVYAPPRTTFVVYRGPSALNNAPIVAIVTGTDGYSANTKTGPMAQLFILPARVAPQKAQRTGADASVCGDCPMRPTLAKTDEPRCYVKTYQGPLSTWKANHDAPVALDACAALLRASNASIRLGAYGDPAALPEYVVRAIAGACNGAITGYTHAWRNHTHRWLQRYCMASADNASDMARAVAEGWRTYRVLPRGTAASGSRTGLARSEILCPHPARGIQCHDCGLCDGKHNPNDRRKNIAIEAH